MEADLIDKERQNMKYFLDVDIQLVDSLTKKAMAKYDKMIASTLIVRGEKNTALIIIDDLNNIIMTPQIHEMKFKLTEICYEEKISLEFNIMLASDVWKHFLNKTPLLLDILRNSYIIQDIGFIRPVQDMLLTGKIRPAKEAMRNYFFKAEKNLKNSGRHINAAILDVYWAVVDVAHAAVMATGMTPQSPSDLADVIRNNICSSGLVNKRCADIMDNTYHVSKMIIHKEKWDTTGKEFDKMVSDAEFFIDEMTEFVKKYKQ